MPSRRPRHDRVRATSDGHQMPADADLGARLEGALRDGLRDGHVDVAQLLLTPGRRRRAAPGSAASR